VKAQAYAPLASPALTGDPTAPTPATSDNDTSIATTAFVKAQAYAPLASPALTGTPTAPTAATSTNTTQLATTAFVKAQPFAPLASPALTGTPTAPTAATSTNTTQLATTAFVQAQAYAPLASPAFTGDPTAPTPPALDNDTSIATTAWVRANGGRVVKTATATWANPAWQCSTGTTFVDVTGATLSFAPIFANSKIIVTFDGPFRLLRGSATVTRGGTRILRGSTIVSPYLGSPGAPYEYGISLPGSGATSCEVHTRMRMAAVDEPNTTSSVTYKLQMAGFGASDGICNVGDGGTGVITIMEVQP
jgi:hypothetical protein